MKKYSEIASRYAAALFSLSSDQAQHNKVFSDIRALSQLFNSDDEISQFINSPLVKSNEREGALIAAMEKANVSEDVKKFVLLLARKNRLSVFDEIVLSFQDKADEANGVTRGEVRSSYSLTPEERKQIEEIVAKATGKNVILTYKVDSTVIGGLIAEVGSYTFDDSIDLHLRKMKEELNRRAH